MLTTAILLAAMPLAAPAADEPEAIYAKYHRAGLAANFGEMLKYGSTAKAAESASMPAAARQAMLESLAQTLPKTYSVAGKTVDAGGTRSTLRVAAPGAMGGTVILLKENGEWKVNEVSWGRPPRTAEPATASEPPPEAKPAAIVVDSKQRDPALPVNAPAAQPKKRGRTDLRDCLSLQTNEAIAKCAYESR
ncbi:MAG: hypothetical protein HY846_02975 [Nitrosomonadales bacterium]|nr:hypothetical protein [Nitrosomonadales bacterium]